MPILSSAHTARPFTVWLTGLSGAGKSTLAECLQKRLAAVGYACTVLDGDGLRSGLNRDLDYSVEDRHENVRRIGEVAHLFNEAGLICIVCAISPSAAGRRSARQSIGPDRFFEIHVSTPLGVCEARDPKGLYRRARRGEIPDFTGISAPYEVPSDPSLAIDTSQGTLADHIGMICNLLSAAQVLEPR